MPKLEASCMLVGGWLGSQGFVVCVSAKGISGSKVIGKALEASWGCPSSL